MQVNVFITRANGQLQNQMLVLPLLPQSAIPPKYRTGWKYFATVDTGDRLFSGIDSKAIEVELASSGYALVEVQVSDPSLHDRRSNDALDT